MKIHTEEESELRFGPFEDADYFPLERSEVYKRISSYGVKSVEFVAACLREEPCDNKLMFIEAKKSLREYDCADISQKFMDSLLMVNAINLGCHKRVSLPDNMKRIFHEGGKIEFILVIKDCGNDSASRLKRMDEALKQKLLKECRVWKFGVKAIDESHAINCNLVLKS